MFKGDEEICNETGRKEKVLQTYLIVFSYDELEKRWKVRQATLDN